MDTWPISSLLSNLGLKQPPKFGAAMRIGHWRLEDKFTQDYVENIGVKEIVVSYLLRHNIDIMIFQVRLD